MSLPVWHEIRALWHLATACVIPCPLNTAFPLPFLLCFFFFFSLVLLFVNQPIQAVLPLSPSTKTRDIARFPCPLWFPIHLNRHLLTLMCMLSACLFLFVFSSRGTRSALFSLSLATPDITRLKFSVPRKKIPLLICVPTIQLHRAFLHLPTKSDLIGDTTLKHEPAH